MSLKIIVFAVLVLQGGVVAQNSKLKSIETYSYTFGVSGDSFLTEKQIRTFDPNGLRIGEEKYNYTRQGNSVVLSSSQSFKYDPASKRGVSILENGVGVYQNPAKSKILFLEYNENLEKSKVLLDSKYDSNGELTKEDTLAYDNEKRLISKCAYNYQGSTSKYCERYKYNRKGQVKRWLMHYYWYTINLKGDAVEKSTKRRDYHFCYNKQGLMTRTKGRYYGTCYLEKIRYDHEGKIAYKSSRSKTKGKKKNAAGKMVKNIDVVLKEDYYERGKLVKQEESRNGSKILLLEATLQDTLPLIRKNYINGKIYKVMEWKYFPDTSKPSHYSEVVYDSNGKLLESRKDFDMRGNVVLENQILQGIESDLNRHDFRYSNTELLIEILHEDKRGNKSVSSFDYDAKGRKISETYVRNGNKINFKVIKYEDY